MNCLDGPSLALSLKVGVPVLGYVSLITSLKIDASSSRLHVILILHHHAILSCLTAHHLTLNLHATPSHVVDLILIYNE